MSWVRPFKAFAEGFQTYLAGLRWLKKHPRYLLYLMIPIILGIGFFIGALTLFATYDETILNALALSRSPEDPWWWEVLYYISKALLYISSFILMVLISFLMMNLIASPIYEVVSWAVEKDVTGHAPEEISWKGLYRIVLSEINKTFFIIAVALVILLIPGFNVLSTAVAAFLLAWDFFDYPLVRRGWSFRQRLNLVSREFWSVLGFGVWMMVPFAQMVTVPLAVAGATLLNMEALKRQEGKKKEGL